MSNSNIVQIENILEISKHDVISVFCNQDLLQNYIDIVDNEVTTDVYKLATEKGRKEISSRAFKVYKVKSALVNVLDDSLAKTKTLVRNANAGKKFLSEGLDDLKRRTRLPLTEWENEQKAKEDKRVGDINKRIADIHFLGALSGTESSNDIANLLDAVSNITVDDFDEFTQDALRAIKAVSDGLTDTMQAVLTKERNTEAQKELDEKTKALEMREVVNSIRMIPIEMMGKPSRVIAEKISYVKSDPAVLDEDGELAKSTALNQLAAMFNQQVSIEATQQVDAVTAVSSIAKAEADYHLPVDKSTYEPLAVWPSDQERAQYDELDRICIKLEEAEDFIEFSQQKNCA